MNKTTDAKPPRIYTIIFGLVYPMYITKVEKKGRTKAEVDEVIRWLTGYTDEQVQDHIKKGSTFETVFKEAPKINPHRKLIKGIICGMRVEEIEDPMTQDIRYLDKLIDELYYGKPMEKILRKSEAE